MDAEQMLSQVRDELQTLREQLDRIEAAITVRGGDTAASDFPDSRGFINRVLLRMGSASRVNRYIPHTVLYGLCQRLLDPTAPVNSISAWLADQVDAVPSKSSLYRFCARFRDTAEHLMEKDQRSFSPAPSADPAIRAEISGILASLRGGSSQNTLLAESDDLLITVLERGGVERKPVRADRQWLASQIGRPVHGNALYSLWKSVAGELRLRRERP